MRNFFIAFFVFSAGLIFPTPSLAQSPSAESATPAAETVIVSGPIFAFDSQVNLSQNYDGPVFASGGQVEFSGSTPEDLVVAGGTVRISGRVEQDVYVAGGSVIIEGEVGGNVVAAGGEVQVLPSARVGGSLIAAGERLRVESLLARSSWLTGENILITSSVNGDLTVAADELTLSKTASISGNLDATVDQENLRDEASVAGTRNIRNPETDAAEGPLSEILEFLYSIAWKLVFMGASLLIFPSTILAAAVHVSQKPGRSAVSGMTWLAGIPLLALVLFITAIGAPLAAFILVLYAAVVLLSWTIPTMAIGKRLLPQQNHWLQAGTAILLLSIVGLIPVVGTLVQIALVVLGVGSLWTLAQEVRTAKLASTKNP